jgi:RNA polymerase-binding transcription factor DksA
MKRARKVLPVIEELEKERAELLQELRELGEALKVGVDTDVDEGGLDLIERNRIILLMREHEHQLQSLDHALQQAQQGSYGICERCHEPIDPARLEAIPDTTFCIKCKTIIEKEQRYMHMPF